ncbi:MAG: hypothetical protein KDG57_14935 [Rhodoferax sp.]|nr:hypothetical protein [Rhodoferax sp.]
MGCCDDTDSACVFSRALLARSAGCACVARRALGEREVLECTQPVARTNCSLLSALMRERARFALKLPAGELPLMHAQVLRLQCGGLHGLQQTLGTSDTDVHHLVTAAQAQFGSLLALPWDQVVTAMRAWQLRRRRPSGAA